MKRASEWIASFSGGLYDETFASLYGAENTAAQRIRYADMADRFSKTCGDVPFEMVSAPGRSEICGNHTDHQGGHVLAATVSLDILAACAPNGTDDVRLYSEGYPPIRFSVKDLSPKSKEKNTSAALARGMTARLTALGAVPRGFDAVISSNVPRGSGLSSSAAYLVLIGSIINVLFADGSFSPTEIAKAGKFAENVYFGKPSGLLDQLACASGGFSFLDFKNAEQPAVQRVDCDFSSMGLSVFITNAGGSHANLTPEYAAVPAEMRRVAAYFGKELLSEVDPAAFYPAIDEIRKTAGDRAVLRAMHFFDEDARVPQQVANLTAGNVDRFLSLIRESGASSFQQLQNVCPSEGKERSVALALALSAHLLNGQGASRVHGGGFAGTIQAFVPDALADAYREGMEKVFGPDTCYRLRIRPAGAVALG